MKMTKSLHFLAFKDFPKESGRQNKIFKSMYFFNCKKIDNLLFNTKDRETTEICRRLKTRIAEHKRNCNLGENKK